jgi:hypothetical protein
VATAHLEDTTNLLKFDDPELKTLAYGAKLDYSTAHNRLGHVNEKILRRTIQATKGIDSVSE